MTPPPQHPRPEGDTRLPAGDPLAGFPGLLDCVHCGLCLQVCPTYRVTGIESDSPRGRIALMRAQAEERLPALEVAPWVDRCVLCRACEPVCPSQVPYHELVERQRAGARASSSPGWLRRTLESARLQRAAGALGRAARRLGLAAFAARCAPRRLRAMAAAVPTRPTAWRPRPGTTFAARPPQRGSVTLHLGCVNPEFFGSVLRDVVAVLTHQGFAVQVPKQPACCGALAGHAGDSASGARQAAATRDALHGADAILVPAAGCAAHLRATDPRGGAVDPLVFLARQGLRGPLRPVERRVAHAPPCHLSNVLREESEVTDLLATIPGLRLVPLAEANVCCGAGGASFQEHPELAADMGARKAAAIAAGGAEWVVAGNPGCLMQIEGSLRAARSPARVLHPVHVLREALGAERPA